MSEVQQETFVERTLSNLATAWRDIAHSAARGSGKAVLGASYDHRLLSGFDVVQTLQAMAIPPRSAGDKA